MAMIFQSQLDGAPCRIRTNNLLITSELPYHWAKGAYNRRNIIPNKKYILQTFVLQNLQQILLYYAHGRLSIRQLVKYFSNGSGYPLLPRRGPIPRNFHRASALSNFFPIKNDSSNNDLRLLAPTPFLQFGYPRSSQSSYFENTKTVSFSRCHLQVGRITALPLVESNGMVYYIPLCLALISLSNCSSVTRPPRHQRWTLYSTCSIPQAFLSRSNLGKEAIPRAPRYKIFFLRGDKIAY